MNTHHYPIFFNLFYYSSSGLYTRTHVQRGLCIYSAYMLDATAGPLLYTCMRLLCYDSYTKDPDVMQVLGSCSYCYYAQPLGIRFYIREDRVSLALLADSQLVRRPTLDYVV